MTPPILSMLDLVAVREGGTVAEALQIAVRTAQCAEDLGFARYWLAEHHCQSASNSFQVSASKFFQLLRLI